MTKMGMTIVGHANRAWCWTLAIAASVYASSSIHRLPGGDSGELLAEACIGGNAHPPGYPLLLLLLRALRAIGRYVYPHSAFVVLANHLNAAFAAGAAACVAHVVELLMGRTVEAVGGGLMFAFSALSWEYALGIEVFALNNFLIGWLLVCFVCHTVDHYPSKRRLYMGAYVCGLGLANQHTIVLFEIPLILSVVGSTHLQVVDWIYLVLAFTMGISPYAYTFRAAQTLHQGSWGDASTVQGLASHILRREYGTFQLSPTHSASDSLFTRIVFYANDVVREFTHIGMICACVGTVLALRVVDSARHRVLRTLLIALIAYVLVFNSLANLPIDDPLPRAVTRRFFMQPNLIIAILLGVGLASLRLWWEGWLKTGLPQHLLSSATIALVSHQYLRISSQFSTSPVAHHDFVRGFGQSILDDMAPNTILLSYTDIQWNAVRYLQTCEYVRPDVVHLNLQIMAFPWFTRQHELYPSIIFPPTLPNISTNRTSQGYATYLALFVRANMQNHPIFLDLHAVDESTITGDQLLFGHLQVLPHNFVWRIIPSETMSSHPDVDQWRMYATHFGFTNLLAKCCGVASHTSSLPIPRGSWEFVVVSIAHDAMYQQNLAKLGYWLTHGSIQSAAQLEEAVIALNAIQHALNDVVWAGVQNANGSITYDLYAVEKNAVVSRQRFQLYLEVYNELTQQDPNVKSPTIRVQKLVDQRELLREQTIRQVEVFLMLMETHDDRDAEALRHALATLKSKRTHTKKTEALSSKTVAKRKKKRKKTP